MIAENFYLKSWNIFLPEVSWNGPGPSYHGREFQTVTYLAAILYVLFGQHDYIGRGISVAFGLWGIIALYLLVRRVWDEEHAIVAAAIMAILPGSIFIERSFLPDPAMVALMITSCLLFVVYLQTDLFRYLVLAGLAGMFGLLTKITGLIIGIPMLYAVIAIPGSKNLGKSTRLVTVCVIAGITLLPVVLYYLWARHLSMTYPPYHFAGAGNWLWSDGFFKWWNNQYFLPKLYWILNNWLLTKPVIILAFLGLIFYPAKKYGVSKSSKQYEVTNRFVKAPWLFHWWIFGGIVFYLIGAKELVSNWWNLHFLTPAASVLAGHAIISTGSISKRMLSKFSVLPVAIIMMALLTIGWCSYKKLPRMYTPGESWDAGASYKMGLALREISKPGDLVVTIANSIGDPVAIYYSQRRGWVFPPAGANVNWGQFPGDDREAIRLFEELRLKGADWFGIVEVHINEFWNNHAPFMEHIENTCKIESKSKDWVIYRILAPDELMESKSKFFMRQNYM